MIFTRLRFKRSMRLLMILLLACPFKPAQAAEYEAQGDLAGEVTHYVVRKQDDLPHIARRFDIGILAMLAANPGVNSKNLREGMTLVIPSRYILPVPREGIVLNLPELRLYYFEEDGKVLTFPVTVGREGWATPLGETTIARKRENPVWKPTPNIRRENPELPAEVPAGPKNPLGKFALNLAEPGDYRIHGTNHPLGIGKRSSHGCIRLFPEDIERLFHAVEVGTKVTVIDAAYKLGWQGHTLWLQVSPTQDQDDELLAHRPLKRVTMPEMKEAIQAIGNGVAIDWNAVETAAGKPSGIPVMIGKKG